MRQPQTLLWVLFTYSVGIGLAHYLGAIIHWLDGLLGLLICILLIVTRDYLSAFFDHPQAPTTTLRKDDPLYLEISQLNRQTLLVMGLSALTGGAVSTLLLMIRGMFSSGLLLVLGAALLICFFSAVPPLRLDKTGYREITEAVVVCNLIPAIAFQLSGLDLHVLLLMLTLPLTMLYLAMYIIFELETYVIDRPLGRQTIVVRMDWLKAMITHNVLILSAFVFVGVFALLGQPWFLTWPMLLPLVLGVFQILQVVGIMNGAPPRWKLHRLTAISTFVVMAYLISFSLFTH
jgi:1,4-dihydroxy-2-naphthoate octaprenyltransferase